ncbi:pyruvate, phosphate dikinase/phosphoenolpyruvate synthase regulator [uncultured Anaerococcus sp.]|uniref:pyruvate, water dikinase regulatory protein n=1 Tax=uncultured Anaerococcus sp. TaxID=293428 RepID=UPI00288ACD79|nr:pyruvate, phosphate dikinase/phosphoenolpyruvate synthase regulator [uncultured Anaerococcus sp.]
MKLVIYIISDSSAIALLEIVKQTMAHFNKPYEIKLLDRINSKEKLKKLLTSIEDSDSSIIYHSFRDSKMKAYVKKYLADKNLKEIGLVDYSVNQITNLLEKHTENEITNTYPSESHKKRMEALDFAIDFDDGQDFRGLAFCDIAIIGVSRSSKTPLSMFLASRGFKVSNIPILVDSKVPKELFEIDPDKIFGLTIDKGILKKIREERLKSLGLSVDSLYSSEERINKEIDNALELMNDLGCTIIDVTFKSIEETSEIIINKLYKNKGREKL